MRGELNRQGMRGWTRKKGEGTAWSSSCSRNAHDENVHVRRAHSRINQAAPSRGRQESLEGMGGLPVNLLCSCNVRPRKMWCKGMRSFLCSRSARPQKGLARRPQSKAPQALA